MSENHESADIVESYVFPNGDVSSIEELASSVLKGETSLNLLLSDEELFKKVFEEVKSNPGITKDMYKVAKEKGFDFSIARSLFLVLEIMLNKFHNDTGEFTDKIKKANKGHLLASNYIKGCFVQILNPLKSYHQIIPSKIEFLKNLLEEKHERVLELLKNNNLLEQYNEGKRDYIKYKKDIKDIDEYISDVSIKKAIDYLTSIDDNKLKELSKSQDADQIFKISFDKNKYDILKQSITMLGELSQKVDDVIDNILTSKNVDDLKNMGIEVNIKTLKSDNESVEDRDKVPNKVFEEIKNTVADIIYDRFDGIKIIEKTLSIFTANIADSFPYITIKDNMTTLMELKDRKDINHAEKNPYKKFLVNSTKTEGLVGEVFNACKGLEKNLLNFDDQLLFKMISNFEKHVLNETDYFKSNIGLNMPLDDSAYSYDMFEDLNVMVNVYEDIMFDKIYNNSTKNAIDRTNHIHNLEKEIKGLINNPNIEITSLVKTEFFNGFNIDINDKDDIDFMLNILKDLIKEEANNETVNEQVTSVLNKNLNTTRQGFRVNINSKEGQFLFFYEIFENEEDDHKQFLIKTDSNFRTHKEVKENYEKLKTIALDNNIPIGTLNVFYERMLLNHTFYCNGAEKFD